MRRRKTVGVNSQDFSTASKQFLEENKASNGSSSNLSEVKSSKEGRKVEVNSICNLNHSNFAEGLDKITYLFNTRAMLNYVTNCRCFRPEFKEFLRNKMIDFFIYAWEDYYDEFEACKQDPFNYDKIAKATKFASNLVSRFIRNLYNDNIDEDIIPSIVNVLQNMKEELERFEDDLLANYNAVRLRGKFIKNYGAYTYMRGDYEIVPL